MQTDEKFAVQLDKNDPLRGFRDKFFIPPDTIYLDGNSLGLMPKDTHTVVERIMDEWKNLGIRGWLDGKIPWFYFAETLGEKTAPLVGAAPAEVICTGTTTVNIHSLISTFYQPFKQRTKILADELNFPTDIYALKSQIKLKGLKPEKELILCKSRDGLTLNEDDIIDLMDDKTAVVFLPSVLYKSGQLLNIPRLTREAHTKDILIGFDCSHSVGTVPHYFNDWEVDFAMWCSYKYLNGGPGCPAFLYLNKRHFQKTPGLAGWFGYVKKKQFDLDLEFEHENNAGGWQISSPSILSSATLEIALDIINEAGIQKIREKSQKLSSYLIYLVDNLLSDIPYSFTIASPEDTDKRGGHVALVRKDGLRVNKALKARGVVPDYRPENLIRVAPVALYNRFNEVWKFVDFLKHIIDKREYENYSKERETIT
ncbi:MAG: kynureninase [bacterium]